MTHLHALLAQARPWLAHYGYGVLFLALLTIWLWSGKAHAHVRTN